MHVAWIGLGSVVAAATTGCSLILDFDEAPGPGAPDAIADVLCDAGEPNDTRDLATPLAPGASLAAGLCERGDRDVYAVTVAAGETATLELRFDQTGGRGDLELELHEAGGALIASARSTDADERLVCPGGAPSPCPALDGAYTVTVLGFADATVNDYELELAIAPP